MKKLFTFFMTLLLVFGCEGLQPTPEAMITLDSEQQTDISIPSDGETFDVCFTSALDWTTEIVYISGGEGWASMNLTSGKGGYSIARLKINVQKNSGSDPRSAKVVITSGAKTAVITFTQEEHKGLLPGPDQDLVFRLTEKRAEVPAEGGTVKVTVEYNVDYKCEVTADWVREIESKSYDQKVHVFEVLPNDSEEPRNTTISFCGNGTCIPFMIEQAGYEASLNVDVKNVTVYEDGTQQPIAVNVTSNTLWTVCSDSDWCVVDVDSGDKNGVFNISVNSCELSEPRIAEIVVSTIEGVYHTIYVMQILSSSGSESKEWYDEKLYHQSLALRFTADWCVYCPNMDLAFNVAQQELPGKIEVISVHADGGLYAEPSRALANYYNIVAFPTGLVDGRIIINNDFYHTVVKDDVINAVRNTEELYETVTGFSWESSFSDERIILDLTAYIKNPGDYKLTVVAVEDRIYGYQAGQQLENYEHNGVLRLAFTDVLGESFYVDEANVMKKFSYSVAVPEGCKWNNMRVVAYIQREDVDTGLYFVDNAASEYVGQTKYLKSVSGNTGSGNEGIIPGDDIYC